MSTMSFDEVEDRINDLLDEEARDGISYAASVQIRQSAPGSRDYLASVIRADNSEASYSYNAAADKLTLRWESESVESEFED